MKLQNMTVIFIIIMIPIILVVSYYIGLQINTITMQKNYTVKLQTAAKDSIQALEINTVEWNSASSNLADSKRRDVLAAINTFTISLANGMGIGGAGKGRIQTYIPAIVYTMYDGYYIYSASLMKDQDTTSEGLTQFNEDGTIKSNETSSYQYILKPYSPYSARYASANRSIDVTVNYTLDNYIRVYGTVNGEYQAKEGYLVVCDSNSNEGVNNVKNGRISKIKYRGAEIKPETLKENVYIVGEEVKEYPYIYDQYDNKLYWDGSNYFSVDKYNNKVYLQEALPEGDAGFSITNRFRKISIPVENRQGELTVQKVFQILNPGGGYYFYFQDESGNLQLYTRNNLIGEVEVKNEQDFSAINYCVESYVFTNWVTKKLSSITVRNMQSPTGGQYNNVDKDANIFIFEISKDNNPDPENDDAYAKSVLAQHKKDIIINTIEKNLSQATAQAQEMNPNYEYRLPQLSYDEWEQALSNISIIAFMQGMPIGLKYYNNYAIATSTLNKEFVDPDELYFAGKDDQYYHQRQCEQATGSDYVGYRSIDYVAKSYEKSDNGTTSTKYYYPHANSTNSELECYYCLVNRSTYKNNGRWNGNLLYKNWSDSYYNALARERYMQLDDIEGKSITDIRIAKNVDETTKHYGETIKYEIQVTNKSTGVKTFDIVDEFNKNINDFISNISINASYRIEDEKIIIENVTLEAGASKTITIEGKVIGNVGIYKNTAKVTVDEKEFKSTEVSVSVVKDVTIIANSIMKPANVVFIIDASGSTTLLNPFKKRAIESAVENFVKKMDDESNSLIGFSRFRKHFGDKTAIGDSPYIISKRKEFLKDFKGISWFGWTNFEGGLKKGNYVMKKMKEIFPNNISIAIFLSDGADTAGNFDTEAANLRDQTDKVYSILFGKIDTNEDKIKSIADEGCYRQNENSIEGIFDEIFENTIINVNANIEGSILISETDLIGSEGKAGEGNWWISLKNDSEFNFKIDSTNESEIANRTLIIKEDENQIGEKTIGEWSREGYIGKANGYIYLNLSKFGAESKITIEIKN